MGAKLEALMKELNKTAKEEIVTRGLFDYSYEKIPFTSPRMNYCTYGGLPVGKLIEFFGEEHGGKTTTALDIVANFQALERQKAESDPNYSERAVLYCDCENTLNVEWARKLNVDVDSMIVLQPKAQSAEQVFDMVVSIVDTDEVGLFVIDSLGAMLSQKELEESIEQKNYAGISKALTVFSKKAEMLLAKHKCTGIGINQVRDDVGSMWGGYTTPGGRAWKHLCSVRIQFSRGKFFDENNKDLSNSAENPCGNFVKFSIVKIKSAPSNRRTGFYTLNYLTGIDYLADLVDVALKFGIVQQSGSWFVLVDPDTGEALSDKVQGQNCVYNILDNDENLLRKVEQMLDEKISLK